MQQLNHQATESLERAWYPHVRIDLDEDTFCGVDKYLQSSRLVKRRVQKREETLMRDVRTSIRNVPTGFCKDSLVIVAVEEGVLDFALPTALSLPSTGNAVCLKARLLQDDEEPPLGGGWTTPWYVSLHG